MKIKELRTKSSQELQNLLKESREKLRNLRFQVASKKLKKVREVRVVKGDVARILTLLNELKDKK